ncbi:MULTISPECIES: phosphatidylinositol mannoside acyltransferase [unclassified Micromonospora]|uniref:phosphatidylinositol mannoside acyltransferase n=1 Tax=unclassified Micromonospora TaxID=2617518 RepID=UPI003A8582EE
MLPRPAAAALFRVGADRAHRRGAASVRRLAANLRRVVGPDLSAAEFDRLTRDAVRSYARYWMEMFRLPSLSRQQRLAGFHLAGAQMLAANVAAGRGSVVALPHAGNWDAAGAWVAANGWPLTTVAERLRPEGVYNRFVAVRQRLGMEIVPASGGPRPPFDVLIDRLAAGHVVPLLADRDLSARGVEVTFFGGRTRMPAGPALLALRTGAPLYVTTMWFEPDRAHGALDGPVPLPDPSAGPLDVRVRLLTQQIADRLAVGIARHPQDWHMMQRLWLDERPDPDPDRSGSSATGPG